MLAWLPTMAELQDRENSLGKLLRIDATDQRTFFGIASNTAQGASSFFGAESADGNTKSIGDLEWFIVRRMAEDQPPAVIRVSDLRALVAARVGKSVRVSGVSTMAPLVRQRDPMN